MTSHGVFYLFVYGSLRKGFRSDAYEYISRFFTPIGDARVKGIMYDMGIYPAAVKTDDDRYIVGELYKIKEESEFSWAFGQLDDYEGVHGEPGEEQLYQRAITEVYTEGGSVPAWIYWYRGNTEGKPVIESGDMLHYMQSKK